MTQTQSESVGGIKPVIEYPEEASLPCDVWLALVIVRMHAEISTQPFAFCGHLGHLIYGSGFSRRMEAVRFDRGEVSLVQALCGPSFASLSVERCDSDPNELARRMTLVREHVLAEEFEWWRTGNILVPVIRGKVTMFDWVAVAPATSCLPYERFAYVLGAWCRGHSQYRRD